MIGIGTEPLTALIASDFTDTYIVARLFSLAGTIIVALLFWGFHYYLLAYVIAALTELPFKWVQKVQLYVILFIVLEKSITLLAFTIVGFNTPFTFFSLAPMTAYIYYHEFLLFFLNQLTVATLVTIFVQYTFFKQWVEQKKNLLLKLILIQLTIAFVVAVISILPIIHWIERGLS
ncbi:MAG: amino acid transporter [Lysinibacillus sp.]